MLRLRYTPPPVGEKTKAAAKSVPASTDEPVTLPPVVAGPGVNYAALVAKLGVLQVQPAAPLTITIRPEGSEKVYRLYATDAAAAIFALRHILPVEALATWLDRVVKEPDDVIALTMNESFLHKVTEGMEELAADSPEGRPIVAAAQKVYDERRPGLIRKFHVGDSWLFYPSAEKASWLVYRRAGTVIARTWCNDLMYAADFYFDMQKDAAGYWLCTRVRGGEFFKGE